MGVMTTLSVSRNVALLALAHVEFGDLTDEQLEERLDKVLKERLYNLQVRGTTCDDDASTLGYVIGADFETIR